MKRTIIAVLLLISINSFAQSKPTREDTLQQIKATEDPTSGTFKVSVIK